jgi:hypothetical protein
VAGRKSRSNLSRLNKQERKKEKRERPRHGGAKGYRHSTLRGKRQVRDPGRQARQHSEQKPRTASPPYRRHVLATLTGRIRRLRHISTRVVCSPDEMNCTPNETGK